MRWRIFILTSVIIATLALAGAFRWATSGSCRNPAFLTSGTPGTGHPIPKFDDIIRVAGGLPRSNASWDGVAYSFPHYLGLKDVTAWRLVSIEAWTEEPIYARVMDDDPTYSMHIEIEVDYADGLRGRLRWSRWQYGLLLCPFVFAYGDGPEWVIESQSLPVDP